MVALFLRHRTSFFRERLSVLDIAPHPSLLSMFSARDNLDYVSADLKSPLAMVKADICHMPFPEESFDVGLCMHVLEHVLDDRQGMREVFRVMKPGGWSILQVPVDYTRAKTFEDPSVVRPEDRERVFRQNDHVRIYGLDYRDRLTSVGFVVDLAPYPPELGPNVADQCGLKRNSDRYVWVCTKPQ